jgi:hypothetical protein
MVLLPGCVCCLTKCQLLAQQIINAESVQLDFSVTSYDRARVGTVNYQCEYPTYPYFEDICGYVVGSKFGSREVCRGQDFSGTFSLTKFYNYKGAGYAFTGFKYQFSTGTSVALEAYSPVVGGSYSLSQIKVGGNALGIVQFDRSSSSVAAPSSYSSSISNCSCGTADANPMTRFSVRLIPSAWVEFSLVDFVEASGVLFYCDDSFVFNSVAGSAVANGYSSRLNTTFPDASGTGFRRASFDDEPNAAPQTTISFSNLVVP